MKSNFLLIIFVFVFFLASCTFVSVQNATDVRVTVLVRVPDSGKGYTKMIRPGEISDTFSVHGGRYSVTMLPGERYEEFLKNMRDIITQRLFKERQTLTAQEVTRLAENLNEIEKLIEKLSIPGATCSGNVPDFETAVAIVSFNTLNGDYVLSCQ